jgi:hypothetical protein
MTSTHDELRSPILWIVAAALPAGGCAAPVHVVDYKPGLAPAVIVAPKTDTYTLLADERSRVESLTLSAGDSIGFSKSRGELDAIAGNARLPLPAGGYQWIIEPPPGETPPPPQPRAISQSQSVDNARNFTRTLAWLAGRAGPGRSPR